MDKALFGTIIGVIAAIVVSIGGVIWLWAHATRKKYDPDELVTVAQFGTSSEADLWKIRLESLGVKCVVVGDSSFRRPSPFPVSDYSGVWLQVAARDVGRARAILGQG